MNWDKMFTIQSGWLRLECHPDAAHNAAANKQLGQTFHSTFKLSVYWIDNRKHNFHQSEDGKPWNIILTFGDPFTRLYICPWGSSEILGGSWSLQRSLGCWKILPSPWKHIILTKDSNHLKGPGLWDPDFTLFSSAWVLYLPHHVCPAAIQNIWK